MIKKLFVGLVCVLQLNAYASHVKVALPKPIQPWLRCTLVFSDVKFKENRYVYNVPVANTTKKRRRGLSGALTKGKPFMLFSWERLSVRSFWMKNVNQSLMIIMINKAGVVTQINKMLANTTNAHVSAVPIKYALETQPSWFSHSGIALGSKMNVVKCYNT